MDFLILIAFGIAMWAQVKVKGNFNKYSKVNSHAGLTGYEVARRILDQNGLSHIPIERIDGVLSDHYDPIAKVVRLSDAVYSSSSIASISVAAHEVGHAIQHKESYGFLSLRHRIFPVASISSSLSPFLLLIGIILQATSLIGVGIALFSAAVFFQLITLPVEFNASSRAKKIMLSNGFVTSEESVGVNKVLGAAALTYVAAALISLLELLKFVMIFFQGNRD
jgi:Zn-dependent membrane protease YugP